MKILNYFGSAAGKSDHRISQLDGWRGISIACVVIGHLLTLRYGVASDSSVGRAVGLLASWGVSIFFVISGFIITKLALSEHKRQGRFSIRDFYIRRSFRIIPPYFFYLGCVAIANGLSWIVQPFSGVLAAAAFVCNFPSPSCTWAVAHTWTLAIEEQFYIIFPLLFIFFNRHIRAVFGTIFCILMALPILRFLLQLEGGWRVISSLAPSYGYICVGALAAAHEDKIKSLSRGHNGQIISATVGLLISGLFLSDAVVTVPLGSSAAYLRVLLHIIIPPVGFAWIVAVSVYQSSYFVRLLATPPLPFVGTISYSLYLWQQLFTGTQEFYASRSPLLIWPLMFLVATLSYYVIERPVVRVGKLLMTNTDLVQATAVGADRAPGQVSVGHDGADA